MSLYERSTSVIMKIKHTRGYIQISNPHSSAYFDAGLKGVWPEIFIDIVPRISQMYWSSIYILQVESLPPIEIHVMKVEANPLIGKSASASVTGSTFACESAHEYG